MAPITWFIILAVALSCMEHQLFPATAQGGPGAQEGRAEFSRQRDDLLDQIAELETRKEAENINGQEVQTKAEGIEVPVIQSHR